MKRTEIVKSMTNSLNEMLESMLVESAYNHTLAKKGHIEVKTDRRGAIAVFKGTLKVMSGDFDAGADSFFVNVPGERGQRSFETADELAEFAAKYA